MDRRTIGIVLVACLLVAVVAVRGAAGRTVSGQPFGSVSPSPRPTAGSCLAPLKSMDQVNTVIDVVPVVPCSQPHSAEILSVATLDPAVWRTRPDVNDARFTGGTLAHACDQLAGRFVGWGARARSGRISVRFFTRLTVPGDLEWQLGQRWYSCELMPGVFDFPLSYVGSARNASIGTPPGAFANCAPEVGAEVVSCDRPHHAEQLTISFGYSQPSPAACRAMVAKVINTPDPTFGGRLSVLVRSSGGSSACWVTTIAGRSLTATLINHGPGPLALS